MNIVCYIFYLLTDKFITFIFTFDIQVGELYDKLLDTHGSASIVS